MIDGNSELINWQLKQNNLFSGDLITCQKLHQFAHWNELYREIWEHFYLRIETNEED